MQGDRDRVPFRGGVVLRSPVGAQERVKIRLGANLGRAVGGVSQGEVEEDQPAALLGQLADGQVVWLDVAMPDALTLQVADRLEQMVAQSLQVTDGEPALAAEVLAQGLLTGPLEDKDSAFADRPWGRRSAARCASRGCL